MAASNIYTYGGLKSVVLTKWKVNIGHQISPRMVMFTYCPSGDEEKKEADGKNVMKASVHGSVLELLVKEGDVVKPGTPLMKIEPCKHEVIFKDMCATCGADLRQLSKQNLQEVVASRSYSMVHIVPELKCNWKQASQLDEADEVRLLTNRKLILLVDLDQTLIHTTNDDVPPNLKDVHHFQLYGSKSVWYHTRLRPHTQNFLEKISKYYELHIFTFGARPYAHKIASILDPNGALFSHRILSRDECFDATSKTGNLKALFPRGDARVGIIDDREDVWNFAPNVIHVKPYIFFNNTSDIMNSSLPRGFCSLKKTVGDDLQNSTNITAETRPLSQSLTPEASILENAALESSTPETATAENSIPETATTEIPIPETATTEIPIPETATSEIPEITTESSPSKIAATLENSTSEIATFESSILESSTYESSTLEDSIKESTKNESIESETLCPMPEAADNDFSLEKDAAMECGDISDDSSEVCESRKTKELYDDDDDYLLYLEEILLRIHRAYFDLYDEAVQDSTSKPKIPDLKNVIPYVRRKVLRGINLVFSGVIPTNMAPEKNSLWSLAKSLGAEVFHDLITRNSHLKTTHVVASKAGTAKISRAKRSGNIHIVTPSWLICCATRWERVDERLFPLKKGDSVSSSVLPPLPNNASKSKLKAYGAKKGKARIKRNEMHRESSNDRHDNRNFYTNTLEPVLDFSPEELDNMGREVEEACTSSEEESDGTCERESSNLLRGMKRKLSSDIVKTMDDESAVIDKDEILQFRKENHGDSNSFAQKGTTTNGESSHEKHTSSDSDSSNSVTFVSSDEEELVAEMERELFGEEALS